MSNIFFHCRVLSRSRTMPREQCTSAKGDLIRDDSVLSLVSATPGRALALARNVPLPATPADVARVVDESTVAIRNRVTTFYEDLGVKEIAYNTRDSLSTITSIILTISAFELYYLRSEVLTNRYAFTIPAIRALGTQDHAVEVPDMFLLLTSSFWGPTLLWALTSIIIPAFFGFYFNLGAAHARSGRGKSSPAPDYTVDPLMFSVAKAIITYVVYQQGVTFGGWISPLAVARINSALYGGWKGVITGAVISGIASFYDAVLQR